VPFGDGGLSGVRFGFSNISTRLVALPRDRLLVSGHNLGSLILARLDAEGRLDRTFGDHGIAHWPDGGWVSDGVAVEASERLLLVGRRHENDEPVARVLRVRRDGWPERGSRSPRGTTHPWCISEIAQQPDGRIVLGGSRGGGFCAARVLGPGPRDPRS
jgi:hypothetical protein